MNNLSKRIITSFFLLLILITSLIYNKYMLVPLLIIISIISFYEFNNLFKKIWINKKEKVIIVNIFLFLYLLFFIYTAYYIVEISWKFGLFIIAICFFSDIGGYVVGKSLGGKKLTKISPNKTIAGSVGSFTFSLIPMLIIINQLDNIISIFIFSLFLSFISQCGDLFVSLLKRKANVKDTGNILPGHGGILDRVDGIIFSIPVAFFLISLFKL